MFAFPAQEGLWLILVGYPTHEWGGIQTGKINQEYAILMKFAANHISMPPWSSQDTWREANNALGFAIKRHQNQMSELQTLARRITQRIESLDALLEDLCSEVCPVCRDSCCQRAWVWFDFKDLLVMHLGGDFRLPEQLRGPDDSSCRYLSRAGCMLQRVQRPYVCTWYLCATLKQDLMQRAPSDGTYLTNSLAAVKSARIELENQFIRIVARGLV
jgi:hypothetical protein